MICEHLIRRALAVEADELAQAKDRLQTRKAAEVIADRRQKVHAELERAVAGHRVTS